MPSKSSAQHYAMAASAAGTSNLGIPKKVGREYVQADKGKKFVRRKKRSHHTVRRRNT